MEMLVETIRHESPSDKIVLVSSQKDVLDAIEAEVVSKRGWGPIYRLDGSVPVDCRQQMVDNFNRCIDIASSSKFKSVMTPRSSSVDRIEPFLFLLSTKAGGVGINL